ncbi:MAG TPA: isochorismatase family protein [Acidimicrobiales bacterium]|nr:isochorismatase family protein [Acidimicrobiales bacterium]
MASVALGPKARREHAGVTFSYDPKTALVVVDVQNDFVDARGSLYVPGGDQAVEGINAEIRAARDAGSLVVYTQDWHPADTPHFAKDGGTWPVHCVAGTWGAELHPALDVAGPVVRKGTGGEDGYSGFSVRDPQSGAGGPTELDAILRRYDTTRLVVVGVATDYCVKDTVLDGLGLGYDVTVVTSAVRPVEVHPGDGGRALAAMATAGARLEAAS